MIRGWDILDGVVGLDEAVNLYRQRLIEQAEKVRPSAGASASWGFDLVEEYDDVVQSRAAVQRERQALTEVNSDLRAALKETVIAVGAVNMPEFPASLLAEGYTNWANFATNWPWGPDGEDRDW